MKRGNEGKITDRGGRKTIKEVNKNTALLRKTGIIVFFCYLAIGMERAKRINCELYWDGIMAMSHCDHSKVGFRWLCICRCAEIRCHVTQPPKTGSIYSLSRIEILRE